jgi:hypothetical protein
VEDLQVDSFTPAPANPHRGTVHGHETSLCNTNEHSCAGTCYTVNRTLCAPNEPCGTPGTEQTVFNVTCFGDTCGNAVTCVPPE